jgi:FkbM family methyltransferase
MSPTAVAERAFNLPQDHEPSGEAVAETSTSPTGRSRGALAEQLDDLLAEDLSSVRQREATAFDAAAGSLRNSLVLFGAGGLGRKTLRGLRRLGLEPLAFADNNPTSWNQQVEGVQVLSPQQAAERFGRKAIFVVTIWRAGGSHRYEQTQAQLRKLGCQKVVPAGLLFWKYPETFLDYYCLGLPHRVIEERETVRQVFSWFEDEVSRREYVSQIRWRLWLDFAGLASPDRQEQYFPEDVFCLRPDEVFVDCGAFDGDSLAAFVRRTGEAFAQIIALEPDPVNFGKMHARVANYAAAIREKVRLEQTGASDFRGNLRFDGDGSLSSAANPSGALQINCVTLDELLRDAKPTYIKMDIEGGEPEALRGAREVIGKAAPLLAVSAYHKPNHLWRIPELIRSLRADYRLYLRPHNEECWDTVCYAVPMNRLNRP